MINWQNIGFGGALICGAFLLLFFVGIAAILYQFRPLEWSKRRPVDFEEARRRAAGSVIEIIMMGAPVAIFLVMLVASWLRG